MNFNGNHLNLDYLINGLRQPQKAAQNQAEFNQKRFQRVEKALATRPLFVGLKFTLPATGQVPPVAVEWPRLNYPAIITGAIADNATREVEFKREGQAKPFLYVGDNLSLHLTLREIAGIKSGVTGMNKIFYWTTPVILDPDERIKAEMYKTDTTGSQVIVGVCFVGQRVYETNAAEANLSQTQKKLVAHYIDARPAPEIRFLKTSFSFDSGAAGGKVNDVQTPECNEPLLIRGVQTNLQHSTIRMKIEGEAEWMPGPVPVWGLGSHTSNTLENYVWFERPFFLPAKARLYMDLVNTFDGTNNDGASGQITFIGETM